MLCYVAASSVVLDERPSCLSGLHVRAATSGETELLWVIRTHLHPHL
jgi:hypothetical protein